MKLRPSLFVGSLAAAAIAFSGCNSSSNSPAPAFSAAPSPTAPPIAAPTFTTVTKTALAAPGVSTLPVGAPVSGSIDFGQGGTIPAGTTLTSVLSSSAPTGVPTLSDLLRQALSTRSPQSANGAIVVLAYIDLLFSNTVTFTKQPSFTLSFPAADVTTAAYYLAAYDPTRPSLGWQLGFEGPGTKLNSTTIVFSGSTQSFTFAQNAFYYFAPYAISASAAPPTPAPSIAPVAPKTAAPTTAPTITPSTAPTAVPSTTPSTEPTGTISPTPAPTVAPTVGPTLPPATQ